MVPHGRDVDRDSIFYQSTFQALITGREVTQIILLDAWRAYEPMYDPYEEQEVYWAPGMLDNEPLDSLHIPSPK